MPEPDKPMFNTFAGSNDAFAVNHPTLDEKTLEEWYRSDNWIPEEGRYRDPSFPRTKLQLVIDALRATRQELAAAKEDSEALEENCSAKDKALGEIHALVHSNPLDGEPEQFDPSMFVFLVQKRIAELEQQLAAEKEGGRLMCIQHAQAVSQRMGLEQQSQRDRERIAELSGKLDEAETLIVVANKRIKEADDPILSREMTHWIDDRAALAKEKK